MAAKTAEMVEAAADAADGVKAADAVEARFCSERLALESLAPHAGEDWVGFERHWDAWVGAACHHAARVAHPSLRRVVFVRASRLGARPSLPPHHSLIGR